MYMNKLNGFRSLATRAISPKVRKTISTLIIVLLQMMESSQKNKIKKIFYLYVLYN
jgi:hypothetical protein